MKLKTATLSSMTVSLLLLVTAYTTHAHSDAIKLTEAQLIAEYKYIRKNRLKGDYGSKHSKGVKLMKGYEISIANLLSSKIKAKTCRELQTRIPSLESGSYVFIKPVKRRSSWLNSPRPSKPILTTKFCASVGGIMTATRLVL